MQAIAMRKETFVCQKCGMTKTIESLGSVVWGPRCSNCHKPMKSSKGGGRIAKR